MTASSVLVGYRRGRRRVPSSSHAFSYSPLIWRERGGPPVTKPARAGLGSLVLQRLSAGSLHGNAIKDFACEGIIAVPGGHGRRRTLIQDFANNGAEG